MPKKLLPYTPTPEDVRYFMGLAASVRDGGTWGMKSCGLVYRLDRANKKFILMPGLAWDHSPQTMFGHHHNDYCLRAIGWSVEPQIDWDSLDCSPLPTPTFHALDPVIQEVAPDDPDAFPVELVTVEHGGVRYGAGKVYVKPEGGVKTPALALVAGDAKHMVGEQGLAVEWLLKNGLPFDDAAVVVAAAVGTPDEDIETADNPPNVPSSVVLH
jgi:hypothetical protein